MEKIEDAILDFIIEKILEGICNTGLRIKDRRKEEREIRKKIQEWIELNQVNEEKYEWITTLVSTKHKATLNTFIKEVKNAKDGHTKRSVIHAFLDRFGMRLGVNSSNKKVADEVLYCGKLL